MASLLLRRKLHGFYHPRENRRDFFWVSRRFLRYFGTKAQDWTIHVMLDKPKKHNFGDADRQFYVNHGPKRTGCAANDAPIRRT